MRKMLDPLVFVMSVFTVVVFLCMLAYAQAERPEHYQKTKLWTMYPVANVAVVDTAGVCLYLFGSSGIAAVAKTQLPVGVGCQ